MVKRARAKHFGLPLATILTEYAKSQIGTDAGALESSYRNTIYCAGVLTQADGKVTARYCSNRWCPVCGRIKMGKAINAYMPKVEGWKDPHFVTLTVQNCSAPDLADLIEAMKRAFVASQKKVKREQGAFVGIRKLECTYGKGYHPHFHVIVEGAAAAHALVGHWMYFARKYTRRRVERAAQDVQRADMDSLIELFKYATKLVAKGPEGVQFISPERLNVIFLALRRARTYQTYGFKVKTDVEDVTDVEARVDAFSQVERKVMWMWDQDMADWVDHSTGELMTGNTPMSLSDHEEANSDIDLNGHHLLVPPKSATKSVNYLPMLPTRARGADGTRAEPLASERSNAGFEPACL